MVKKPRHQRVDRLTHPARCLPARVFRLLPDPTRPAYIVEVRVARSRRAMREEVRRIEGKKEFMEREVMGMVRTWFIKTIGRTVLRPGRIVARIYLNVPDLRAKPSEIPSHEATHAGMGWARWRRANLNLMAGEEVLAHAVGQLVTQLNRVLYSMRVW